MSDIDFIQGDIYSQLCKNDLLSVRLMNILQWVQDKMAAIFVDNLFKSIFLNKNHGICIQISFKFVWVQ